MVRLRIKKFPRKCKQCNLIFKVVYKSEKTRFCSSKCYGKSIVGHKSWNKGLKGWHSKSHMKAIVKHNKQWHKKNKVWSTGTNWWKNPKNGKAWTFKGVITATNGYISIYKPEHPKADSRGYVYEHRYLMEQKIGRILERNEIVHHKNHDRHDNRLENLELMSKAEHNHIHHFGIPKPRRAISCK